MSLRKKPETGSEGVNKPMGKRQRMIERYKKTILDFFDKNVGKSKLGAKARKAKREREKPEQQTKELYAKKIEESREGKEVIITKDKVVAGLKFIAEHPDMEQNQLVDELIALGCNFSIEDIKKQFPGERLLFPGIERGELPCGASVIANCMISKGGRSYCEDRFLSVDDETSIYGFIRKVTGDESYTKVYVDSLLKSNVDKLKKDAVEIPILGGTRLENAVNMLLEKKAQGVNCFIEFNGEKIYSVEVNSVDDAYLQCFGETKAELDAKTKKAMEEREKSEQQKRQREEGYAKKVEESREGKEVVITKDKVVAGLKFIAENPDMGQDQLIDELIALGCNFSFEDIKKQFPEGGSLFEGMKSGDLASGASVIVNYMISEDGRSYGKDRFLDVDDETSVYGFIRKVTGDESYTKAYVDSLAKGNVDKLKKDAVEITILGGTKFKDAVNMLLEKKAEYVNCFIEFNGEKIYSVEVNSVDDAYLQYFGETKAELDAKAKKSREEWEKSEQQRKQREEGYAKKIEESREGKEVVITKDKVVAGLKFIAEHPNMGQDQLIDELIALGCNFSNEDIKKQFPGERLLFPGMKSGDLGCGASVIVNYMSSEPGRSYCEDRFLSVDDETSIYGFIRKVTGDKSYTKAYLYTKTYVDSLVNKKASD